MTAPDKAAEIKAAIAAFFAFLTALWGWLGWAIIVWLGCVLLDYITGTWAAKSNGEWSSAVARAGLWHKLGEIVAVLVAALCDIAIGVILKGSGIWPFEVAREYLGITAVVPHFMQRNTRQNTCRLRMAGRGLS